MCGEKYRRFALTVATVGVSGRRPGQAPAARPGCPSVDKS